MMSDDLDIFYNSDEFGVSALYLDKEITIIEVDDIEVSSAEQKVISVKTSDAIELSDGDPFVIDGVNYEVGNFDYKDSSKLEFYIALKKVD